MNVVLYFLFTIQKQFFDISDLLFLSQRTKQRRRRRRETLTMRHLKRAMMVMRRDENLIISLIHRIGLSLYEIFLILSLIATVHN
jgi:hypothetical protein